MKGVIVILLFVAFVAPGYGQTKNLDYYLNIGLSQNPLLKDLANQALINGIDSQRIGAFYKPQVTGIGSGFYAPYINGFGYDPALSNITAVNALVNVNQTFVGQNNLKTQYAALHLLTDSARNVQKITEQDLKRNIITQYIIVWGDLQQLAFYKDVNNILQSQESLLKNLTQSNIYRQTDYLTFFVTFQQQQLQLKQINIQLSADFSTLNYLCGINDTAFPAIADPEIKLDYLPDPSNSIFFLRYKIDSYKLENQVSLVNYSYKPKLTGFINGGYSSSFLYDAYKNFGYSMGLNLSVPIYDGHQKRMQTEKIHIAENTRLGYQDFFARQYTQQVTLLKEQLKATEALINDINEQIKYAQGLIKVNGKLLETGDAKISDYVIAINNYLTAKNLLTQNNISRMQLINQLNYWSK